MDNGPEKLSRKLSSIWASERTSISIYNDRMRTYHPKAYAKIPVTWATVLCEGFISLGYKVEQGLTDEAHSEAWIRVYGMTQSQLCQRLNDPLGEPGMQKTHGPNTHKHLRRRKPLTPDDFLTAALIEEEERYLKPDWD